MHFWYCKNFQELTIEELYQILQLRNEVFVVEQNCVYQDADGKDLKAFHLFYKDKNQIVAYARIFKPGDYFEKASIGRVVVAVSHRKQKLGNKLMQEAIDFVQNELKEKSIEISAQTYLDTFYRDLGFVPYGEIYLEDGIPHRRMVWNQTY